MELKIGSTDDIRTWEEVTLLYHSALKQMNTKISILNDEFQQVHRYNPIEHTKARMKTPESIVKKLKRHGYESNIENMVKYVNDIAGIRIICSFTSDIYRIADMISNQGDVHVIAVRDYIMNPKTSGYRSYHMVITVPVYLSDRIIDKIRYKFEGNAPTHINAELFECSHMVSELDSRMMRLNEEIQQLAGEKEEPEAEETLEEDETQEESL